MQMVKLSSLVDRKIGYGIVQPGQSTGKGIPVIKVNNIISGLKNVQSLDTTSPENDAKYMRTKLKGGELIVSVVGTIGKTAIVPHSFAGCNLVRATALVDIPNQNICRWVKYYIDSPDGQQYIKQNLNTTVQPTLNIQDLAEMPIPLPGEKEIARIVRILFSIDQNIECNQAINDNLQQQAFAVFDNLLKDKQKATVPLSSVAEINPKRDLGKSVSARCIDMARLSTSGSFPDGWDIKPYNGGMKFRNGDTLLARITPCLENGKTAFIDFLDDGEVAFGSTEYIVMCPKGDLPPEFLYCLARYPSFVDYAVKNMNGSSGRQRVSAETIGKYEIPLLSEEDIEPFVSTVPGLFRAMRNNAFENMRLADLRDALLPRLMSGDIDVSAIDV